MNCQTIKKWWNGLFQKKREATDSNGAGLRAVRVAPLTVGLRVHSSLPTGRGRAADTTHFIWVSPQGSNPPENALKVLLSPN